MESSHSYACESAPLTRHRSVWTTSFHALHCAYASHSPLHNAVGLEMSLVRVRSLPSTIGSGLKNPRSSKSTFISCNSNSAGIFGCHFPFMIPVCMYWMIGMVFGPYSSRLTVKNVSVRCRALLVPKISNIQAFSSGRRYDLRVSARQSAAWVETR